jgi:hypothetical protein
VGGRSGSPVAVTGVGEAMTTPQTARHGGTSHKAFEEPAPGPAVKRAATIGAASIIIDHVVGFCNANGRSGFWGRSPDGRLGKPESYSRRRCCRLWWHPSRAFRDLPVVIFLELLVRQIIRMRRGPRHALEQTPSTAEGAAAQVVSHVPQRVIDEPVAGRPGLCSSTPGARTRHSHTSARHDVMPRPGCGKLEVPQAARDIRLCLVVAVFRCNEH